MSTERKAHLRTLQQKARQLAIECELLEDEMGDCSLLWARKVTIPLQEVSAFMLKLQKRAKELEKKPGALFLL